MALHYEALKKVPVLAKRLPASAPVCSANRL
jgi:hypothetical protein